jgi:trimeric autotransporter adhesin
MPTFNGTSGGDVYVAPDDQDWSLAGLGGADALTGAGGNDLFTGGKGNDTLNGGAGNDSFLVGGNGGADAIDGGDSVEGGMGYDIIKATANDVKIGLASITGIEEISADGFANVSILGSTADNLFDFSFVVLTGIGLISGGNGNDTIIGNADANLIEGGSGNDSLSGGEGDDIFLVGKNSGFDYYDGGLGTDSIVATADGVSIGLSSLVGIEAISGETFFNVRILGTSADDYMYFVTTTLTNIFEIDAGNGNDTMIGSALDNTMRGGDGDDFISGGAGNDVLYGDKGSDTLSGGTGDDSFYISAGTDLYKGAAGYDVIYAGQNGANLEIDQGVLSSIEEISANGFYGVTISAANALGSVIDLRHVSLADDDITAINGGNGADTIFGSLTYDYIYGGLGSDSLSGYNGDDIIHGGGGADTLVGGLGYDELHGDAGNDLIDGGASDDIIFGDAGDDTIMISGSPGFDVIDGGTGFDSIVADAGVKTIKFYSIANIEAISWDGSHLAQILGSYDADLLDFTSIALTGIKAIDGGTGNDTITGSGAGDSILGDEGNDVLLGGLGADILTGGVGADTLTGGMDGDIFRDKALNFDGDSILDFALGDEIHITNAKNFAALSLSYDAGVLTVSGPGAFSTGIDIALAGSFTTASFEMVSDGANGVLIHLIA